MGNYDINLPGGVYHARAISAGAYETTGGALMLGVQWELDNEGRNTITSRDCLITKAGAVMERNIKSIREWAPGWDGVDTEWFGQHFSEIDVNLVIERRVDSYDGKEKPEVKYINPINRASHGAIPGADQKALGAKFGAKLRAFAGTMPKPIVVGSKPTMPADDKKAVAWDAFKEAFSGEETERNAEWLKLIGKAVPGKTDYTAFTPADWDAVIKAVEEYAALTLPF